MSDLAVTGDYFEEAVDEEISNGPTRRKKSGQSISTSCVVENHFSEEIVADKQAIPSAVPSHLLDK